MAHSRTPREAWVDHGLRALAAGGPEAVRVEALARDLGVTKGGFYWHFADRPALLDAILETWERRSIDAVIERVEGQGGDARERLRHLFSLASTSDELRRVDLAVRDWARRDQGVARRLRRVDNRRMDYMRGLFSDLCATAEDAEARCLIAFTVFVGLPFVHVDHPTGSRSEVLQAVLRQLEA